MWVAFHALWLIRRMVIFNTLTTLRGEFVRAVLTVAWPNRHPDALYHLMMRAGPTIFGKVLVLQWDEIRRAIDAWRDAYDDRTQLVVAQGLIGC